MSLGNPAGMARENAGAYVRDLLGLLGDRDPFAVQEELVAALAELIAGLGAAALRRPEAPGKWSILEVLAHLADTELVYRYRMRRAVAEPEGAIEGYDQDAWARELRYRDADADEMLVLISALRQANLRWLRGLADEELDRAGVHSERGPEKVRKMVSLIAGHDLVHRRQIARIRRALGLNPESKR